ncbi:capsule biosynthesis protein [Stenoxybacter acetivorans]|uniref:capsule biosynthesis protein n=1 Tax=Stenoxybacter acetivorans TaxID=422441 RepID=UPI00055EAF6D|nr:capsular biosynthesis protein [Stenoxybacter acetivorans]
MQSHFDDFLTQSSRILFLQGPVGGYFFNLGEQLTKEHSKVVFKINFNGGDRYFYPETTPKTVSFSGSPSEFQDFLIDFIRQNHIDAVVCFGDNRIYHRIAKQVCNDFQTAVSFWVFEEGYFRPHYITFERSGVNDYSTEPRDAEFYQQQTYLLSEPRPPKPVAPGFRPLAKLASQYYWQMYRQRHDYPHYQHHRSTRLLWYIKAWGESGLVRLKVKAKENHLAKQVEHGQLGNFFIVPLQVHNDSQIKVHSPFKSVAAFIQCIVKSFAQNAPINTKLVIKHHPMDIGFVDYGKLIKKLTKHYQLQDRIYYVYNIPLPIFLRRARGMVVVNSTSAISAMIHHLPVKMLGKANYDIDGLVDRQDLADFWQNSKPLNYAVFHGFYCYQLQRTQLNATFY